jgi:hypothetical protein
MALQPRSRRLGQVPQNFLSTEDHVKGHPFKGGRKPPHFTSLKLVSQLLWADKNVLIMLCSAVSKQDRSSARNSKNLPQNCSYQASPTRKGSAPTEGAGRGCTASCAAVCTGEKPGPPERGGEKSVWAAPRREDSPRSENSDRLAASCCASGSLV